MGIGGLGIGKVLIVVLIVLVLFGGKRLRSLGSDLGETVKGLRKALGKDDR